MADTPRRAGAASRGVGKNKTGHEDLFLAGPETSSTTRSRRRTLQSYQSFPHLAAQSLGLGWHTDTGSGSPRKTPASRGRRRRIISKDDMESESEVYGVRRISTSESEIYGLTTPTPAARKLTAGKARARHLEDSPTPSPLCMGRHTQARRLTFSPADIAAAAASVAGGSATPASAPVSGAGATMFTPAATKLVRPDPAAFMSTGLQSRKQHVRTRSSGAKAAPETPCKRAAAAADGVVTPSETADGDAFRLAKTRAASPGSLRRTRKRPHVTARDSCDDLRVLLDTPSRPRQHTLVDDCSARLPPPAFRIPALAEPPGLRIPSDACSDSTVDCEFEAADQGARFLGRAYFESETDQIISDPDYFTHGFDVLRRIGEGEFSSVYSVRSVADGRTYAIKRARRAFGGRLDRQRRLREVELLWAAAPCESIVRLEAAWEQRGLLHLQLELCAGGSLAAWLDARAAAGDERLAEPLAWSVLSNASRGLAHLHSLQIAHFDVKPANFLLHGRIGEPGWLKLADFGHAVRLPPAPDAWVDEGDREYLAPEMLGGVYTAAADVFSLGMMMLEIVADVVLPANGADWHNLRIACFDDPAFARLPYSPHLLDTVKLMLRPDHTRRPALADVVATASCASTDNEEDSFDDIDDDDFLSPQAESVRRPLVRASTASTYFHCPLQPDTATTRPASAGPGLARRTASAPGAAPTTASFSFALSRSR
ncbi:mitosis inhibitor protein kinase swe1 [Coemansia sp. BCRC 34301]|nr:mitosis inhibitor protein kinase swe1 [Coemansia sp. BCRC 34301]